MCVFAIIMAHRKWLFGYESKKKLPSNVRQHKERQFQCSKALVMSHRIINASTDWNDLFTSDKTVSF